MPDTSRRRRGLIAYFVLTYLLSWAIEVRWRCRTGGHRRGPAICTALPGLLRPLVAAVLVTLATEGSADCPGSSAA